LAHITEVVGTYSELVAQVALIANGYKVSSPAMAEPYDLKAEDPLTGTEYKIQVKTIRKRGDRRNELVVYATNGSGASYEKSDVDLFIGVLGGEGEVPRVFMFENRSIKEYWATEAKASERWVELPIWLNRDAYNKNEAEAV